MDSESRSLKWKVVDQAAAFADADDTAEFTWFDAVASKDKGFGVATIWYLLLRGRMNG